jgi:hypothetical protein
MKMREEIDAMQPWTRSGHNIVRAAHSQHVELLMLPILRADRKCIDEPLAALSAWIDLGISPAMFADAAGQQHRRPAIWPLG